MSYPFDHKPWLKSYDEGVPHTVEVPDHPLQQFLEDAARKHPNHTAMIFKGRSVTYKETKEMADAIAAGLIANGFKKGDRAVIYMPNTPQFVATYYGILKAGGVVVATNPLYTERELEHQLADCGAETVFVMSLFYNRLKAVQKTGHTKVKRVIVTNIKEYLPTHLRILFGLLKEKKEGHRVTIENGDMAFQDFLAMGIGAPPIGQDEEQGGDGNEPVDEAVGCRHGHIPHCPCRHKGQRQHNGVHPQPKSVPRVLGVQQLPLLRRQPPLTIFTKDSRITQHEPFTHSPINYFPPLPIILPSPAENYHQDQPYHPAL